MSTATIEPQSLGQVVDLVNKSFFYGENMESTDREHLASWISSRLGKPRSYAGMFAPTDSDFRIGVRVFTGEPINSRAGTSHAVGEEACRALILLDVRDSNIKSALRQATLGMLTRLRQAETEGKGPGMYCCGTCSVAYWRHIAAGGLDRNEERLTAGRRALKGLRNGAGDWRRFPFCYTLLALSEIDLTIAREEIEYAAPTVQRHLKRSSSKDEYSLRRRTLFERVLAKI